MFFFLKSPKYILLCLKQKKKHVSWCFSTCCSRSLTSFSSLSSSSLQLARPEVVRPHFTLFCCCSASRVTSSRLPDISQDRRRLCHWRPPAGSRVNPYAPNYFCNYTCSVGPGPVSDCGPRWCCLLQTSGLCNTGEACQGLIACGIHREVLHIRRQFTASVAFSACLHLSSAGGLDSELFWIILREGK